MYSTPYLYMFIANLSCFNKEALRAKWFLASCHLYTLPSRSSTVEISSSCANITYNQCGVEVGSQAGTSTSTTFRGVMEVLCLLSSWELTSGGQTRKGSTEAFL